MAEFVNVDELKKNFYRKSKSPLNEWDTAGIFRVINETETADVVAVVRCKECARYPYCCRCPGPDADWFCADGLPKDEAESR